MARKARLIGKNIYHHIYAWGNDRNPIFAAGAHYEKYLEYLDVLSSQHSIDIIAYALLSWHVHLFLFDSLGLLSRFMNSLHGRYAQYFNRSTKRVGHVFGERFNNRVVQANEYGLWLSRYIHRQAVQAGIVEDPKDYPWTSYRAYMGMAPWQFLKPEVILDQFAHGSSARERYRNFVMSKEDGPIDWSSSCVLIVGDSEFTKDARALLGADREGEMDFEDLIKTASHQLGVDYGILTDPQGLGQRKLRREVFSILVQNYGVPATEIARIFGVSRSTVTRALR